MVTRENNIFYNVIRNETSLTEVFCNFMQYKVFRNLFIELINKKRKILNLKEIHSSSIKYDDFFTELYLKEEDTKFGRGDLILKNKDIDYIFELKIEKYTTLTKNQPESYLKYLKNDNTRLYFIIPKGYMHKDTIYDRWTDFTDYTRTEIDNHIIFWEDIIKEIRDKEIDKLNLFINEFCNILDYRWFNYPEIRFSNFEVKVLFQEHKSKKKELTMLIDINMPNIISKLFKIVEAANDKLDTTKDNSKTDAYYGYILKNKNISENIEIWFGVDFEIWEQHSFPLSIQVYSDDKSKMDSLDKLDFLTNFNYADGEKTNFFGLERNTFENEEDNITEVFIDKINEIVTLVK